MMNRPSSRLRSAVISQTWSLSWKMARATGSLSSTWLAWNRPWRTMRVPAIPTMPNRDLSSFPKFPPTRFNWQCKIYGTKGTSNRVQPVELLSEGGLSSMPQQYRPRSAHQRPYRRARREHIRPALARVADFGVGGDAEGLVDGGGDVLGGDGVAGG